MATRGTSRSIRILRSTRPLRPHPLAGRRLSRLAVDRGLSLLVGFAFCGVLIHVEPSHEAVSPARHEDAGVVRAVVVEVAERSVEGGDLSGPPSGTRGMGRGEQRRGASYDVSSSAGGLTSAIRPRFEAQQSERAGSFVRPRMHPRESCAHGLRELPARRHDCRDRNVRRTAVAFYLLFSRSGATLNGCRCSSLECNVRRITLLPDLCRMP